MSTAVSVRVRLAQWPDDAGQIRDIRECVFVEEQGVDPALEWDGQDPQCLHVLACGDDGRAVATARLLPDGHIGRMAVLADWRGRGIGRAMLERLIDEARTRGFRDVALNAQVQAMEFYAASGFVPEGEPFIEADIAHRRMRRNLEPIE